MFGFGVRDSRIGLRNGIFAASDKFLYWSHVLIQQRDALVRFTPKKEIK